MLPTIRPMLPADAAPAADAVLRGDWGDRRAFFAFAASHPGCRPIVAEADGAIVGTGVGTVNGSVGWVGTIYVDPDRRGRGLGRTLTEAVVDGLEAAGCRTLVLVATEAGRPLYERLGFEAQARYLTVEAPGTGAGGPAGETASGPPDGPRIRRLEPGDLGAVAALDRAATGEDRAHLLRAFARQDGNTVLVGPDGEVRGALVRAPWGGGATIVPDQADAAAVLDHRRALVGPDRRVRAGVLDVNAAGHELLRRLGWTDAWSAPRLVRGEPLDWRPDWLWGQFNHAIG